MHAGTLVLFTDQQPVRSDFLGALQGIAPCMVLGASETPPPGPYRALVVDLDLLQPSPLTGLRALIANAPGLPRVFLMRSMGQRSMSAARGLGACLCLPAETPVDTIVAALRTQIGSAEPQRPKCGLSPVAWAADATGAVIADLLDAARRSGAVDAARIDEGLEPVIEAVGVGGLSSWLATVRAYDDATYQHCLLVTGLAAAFALDLGFSVADRLQLVRAALVHDVGKARIPLAILNKPGPLDTHERAVMREHAAVGHAILVQAGGFDEPVLTVVRHHHEMLDGSGYPDGLRGEAIPDIVRLITICDVYAALVERRPYRAPLPAVAAMGILRGMEGKLDPILVQAFARAVDGS
ncbi:MULTISPECIES: HD-GYP domain-containing protein [unclassified Methylobacterium]|uniref:HD-GYP domain-containing protein n=1 Tax=unclassified Methylobacterium TaxID=2615210 RepID=UPI00226A0F38|nr:MULTISPECIES: HD-GYP domain-containing protein [unclassified Methylobacterium]